jgi:hypothetical protein
MSVAIPITTPPAAVFHGPSLWELGQELQQEARWIAQLAERLHEGDEADHAQAIADLEESLASQEGKREALQRKADATCWVVERLRADSAYHQSQARRFSALARSGASRADALEASLVRVLTRAEPSATRFRFKDHHLTSRSADAVEIDDPEAVPAELQTTTISHSPDKSSIKARIKAAIASAIAGLPKAEAASVARRIASSTVPGARLVQRRHWSIR